MSSNNVKKTMIFSSEDRKKLVDLMVSDESSYYKRQPSSVLEDHLISALLPGHPDAAHWMELFYTGKWDAGRVLYAYFSYIMGRVETDPAYRASGRLVELLHEQACLVMDFIEPGEEDRRHLAERLRLILSYICECRQVEIHSIPSFSREWYIKDISEKLDEAGGQVSMAELYSLVLSNWEDLCACRLTYLFLADLARLGGDLPDTGDFRVQLNRVMKEITAGWGQT